MVASPAAHAVTIPSDSTSATASLSELQVTSLLVASAGSTVAVNVTASPTAISSSAWSRVTPVTKTFGTPESTGGAVGLGAKRYGV